MLFDRLSLFRSDRGVTDVGAPGSVRAVAESIVCIGGSHTSAIAHAARRASENVRVINLTRLPHPFLHEKRPDRLHPAVVKLISIDGAPIFSMIGGNAHNLIGLARHPRPFDFIHPSEPDLPLDPTAEILPYAAVKAAIERQAGLALRQLQVLASHYPGRVTHVEAPPPVEDVRFADAPRLAERLQAQGVAPAMLRYRLWRLHTAILRSLCDKLDVPFLHAPPEAMDKRGFLRPALTANATHGNARYGALVLAQMKAAIA